MVAILLAAVVLASLSLGSPTPSPIPDRSIRANYAISVGSPPVRVGSGTVWLQSYSWNGGDHFKIGTIVYGKTTIAFDDRLSPALKKPGDANHDNWVILFNIGQLQGQPQWYSTSTLNHSTLFSHFHSAVNALGQTTVSNGETRLVLPAPTKRIITFVNSDGTPVARTAVGIALHVSDADHCGAEQGPDVGTYTTDTEGRLALTLPTEPLMLGIGYLVVGTSDWWREGLVVGSERSITIRRNFRYPPQATWYLTVKRRDGRPVSDALVSAYYNAGCGSPQETAQTDREGRAALRVTPRLTGWVRIMYEGREHYLADAQRRTLEKDGRLDVIVP